MSEFENYRVNEIMIIAIPKDGSCWWWETKASAGNCWYDEGKQELTWGPSKVYTAYHHYPCGNSEIDREMKQEIDDKEKRWPAYIKSLPPFPYPIKSVVP